MKKKIVAKTDEAQEFLNLSVPDGLMIQVENQVIQKVKLSGKYDLSRRSMRDLLYDALGGGYLVNHANPFKEPADVREKYPDNDFGVKHVSTLGGSDPKAKAAKEADKLDNSDDIQDLIAQLEKKNAELKAQGK